MIINDNGYIELYWNDLTEKAKEELLELWGGDNGNYDIFPLAELPYDIDPQD